MILPSVAPTSRETSSASKCPLANLRPSASDEALVAFTALGLAAGWAASDSGGVEVSQNRTNSAKASLEMTVCRFIRSIARLMHSSRRASAASISASNAPTADLRLAPQTGRSLPEP